MWHGLRISSKVNADFAAAARTMLQSTLRVLILTTVAVYLPWYVVANVTSLWPTVPSVTLVLLVGCVPSMLALWLLPRRLLAAQCLWFAGITASITLATHLFWQPEATLLYALLPLLAALTVGWPAGLLAEGAVIGLVWWASHTPFMPPQPLSISVGIVIGGALGGIFGWAATRTLLTVTKWSLFSYEQARRSIEQARDQRLESKQVQEDLVQMSRELARLSDRLAAMHRVAEEARRAKSEFVANVSHELRTPLNMIIGFSEMITQAPQIYGMALPPTLLADIAAIQRNSQHLSRLVDDVLDLSQVEAGHMALSREWASMPEIIASATVAVRSLFDSKGLYLETEIATDLPSVFCDSTRIRQVLLNLLSNAGRLTVEGGVRIRARREADQIVVSVADTGTGISTEEQKELFEPFHQLGHGTEGRRGGSGLGLSISKQLIEMHGGRMWLQSQEGLGATFCFSLPSEAPAAAGLTAEGGVQRWFSPYHQYEARTRPSRAPAPLATPRFVLLEQGSALRRLLNRYVDGIEVVSRRDREVALEELRRSPALALIVNGAGLGDGGLPAADLGDLPYGTPALACWVPDENEAARKLGVVHYLTKPISRELLLSTLTGLGEGVKNVLVVDDEAEVLQLFARMLSTAGHEYRILQATSGRRALSLLRRRRPDVMLLDLIMPGMNGLHVLHEKSQDPAIRDIPVVVISSRDPVGYPMISSTLSVAQGGGLSAQDLLACILAVTEILCPSSRADGRGRPGRRAS